MLCLTPVRHNLALLSIMNAVVEPHSALFIAMSLWITGKLDLKAVVAQVADKVEHR